MIEHTFIDKDGNKCARGQYSQLCQDKKEPTKFTFISFDADPQLPPNTRKLKFEGTEKEIIESLEKKKNEMAMEFWLKEAKEVFNRFKPRKVLTCKDVERFTKDEYEAKEEYADFEEKDLSEDEFRHYQYWKKKGRTMNCKPFE